MFLPVRGVPAWPSGEDEGEGGGGKRAGVKRYSGIFVDSLYGLIVL